MIDIKTLGFVKWGLVFFFIISVLINALSGLVVGIRTGDYVPFAENTIGLLISGDDLAYQMEKDIVEGRLAEFPEEYQDEIRKAFFQTIFINIFASIVMLILLFKFYSWIFGIKSMESTFDIMSAIISVATYSVLGIIYTIIMESAKTGAFTITLNAMWSAVPLKSLAYGIYHLPDLLGFL